MKLHANVLKISYFFYWIIDRITGFSFIIFSDFIHFMKCFILSTINYHVLFFSPLPIIYCILWFVCQSLYNKPVQSTGQKSSGNVIPCPKRMLVCFWAQFIWSSSFLGLRLQITCLGTWKQNSFLCKVAWGLLNLHSLSSQSLDNSSDVLDLPIYMISSWITSKKPLKLLCFGKTRITDSHIENITKVSKSKVIVLILLLFAAKTYWKWLKNMLRIILIILLVPIKKIAFSFSPC